MAVIKEKKCYTVQEIQEILNISRPSVYNLLKKGEFHSVFVAGKHMISKTSFDAWLNGCEVEPKENDYARDNDKEITGSTEAHQLQKQQGSRGHTSLGVNMRDANVTQEAAKYQRMQERFLQNMMKAYLMIEATGHIEQKNK